VPSRVGVAYVQPGVATRLLGGLGPLQEIAASGALTWKFESIEQRTRLTWTYRVTGMQPDDVGKLSGVVDQVRGAPLPDGRASSTRAHPDRVYRASRL
jgi:hypothetical protein